jgi:guanylate kinase
LIRRRGALFVVSAPSGAGKTTLCREARLRLPDLAYSVSYTTRPPRPGEIEGTDFVFVSEPEFRTLQARGEFAEWATVHGNLYGTRARVLEEALAAGHDVLLDIDTQGAAQLRARYPEAVLVFIVAPSMDELALWRRYDYLVVNRDQKDAADQLTAIIMAERCRAARLALEFPDLEVST